MFGLSLEFRKNLVSKTFLFETTLLVYSKQPFSLINEISLKLALLAAGLPRISGKIQASHSLAVGQEGALILLQVPGTRTEEAVEDLKKRCREIVWVTGAWGDSGVIAL